eukprot:jgi/Mesvir1/6494/Mv16763-RA.2
MGNVVTRCCMRPEAIRTSREAAADEVHSPPDSAVKGDADAFDPEQWNLGYPRNFSDHYTWMQELGHGSFGTIHLTQEKRSTQLMATKTISKIEMNRRFGLESRSWLKMEVQVMSMMSGLDNVVRFYGAYEDVTSLFLVMELCSGGELLTRILQRKRFTEADASRIVRSILKVVAECHLRGIIHRDIKPENFLFATEDEQSDLKLIDFGLAAFTADIVNTGQPLTDVCGTPYYMAPELLQGKHDLRADVWSVGVIMYILLGGRFPFGGDTVKQLSNNIIRQVDLGFNTYPWTAISSSAKTLLQGLLQKDPVNRPSAAQALSHPWVTGKDKYSDATLDVLCFAMMRRYSYTGKMKQLARKSVIAQMDLSKRPDVRDQFNLLDKNRDGRISTAELTQAMESINLMHQFRKEWSGIFHEMDQDGDGFIDYTEFASAVIRLPQLMTVSAWEISVERGFAALDVDGDGFITPSDIRRVRIS